MNVWTHWEGPKVPYIETCLDTIRQHCYKGCLFHQVNEQTMSKYIPEGLLHPNWKNIKRLGVKSDCIRAAVLYLYGGLYVDADSIMLKSPKGRIDESKDCVYMRWSTPPDRVIAGYIYCKQKSVVAKKWLDNINATLERNEFKWCQLGEGCLTPAVNSTENCEQIPLKTFLPIEIDIVVEKFFRQEEWQRHIAGNTIAFGLNHSWFMSRRPKEMAVPFKRMATSKVLLHRLLHYASEQVEQPRIGVICCTYRRPELLRRMLGCFDRQSYQNRTMIILDDSGELEETVGDKWRVISCKQRFESLGAKRHHACGLLGPGVDAIAHWDDDDLAEPHALAALAAGLRRADWVRPSQVLTRMGKYDAIALQTWADADRSDKAYHPAWAYSRSLYDSSAGYPLDTSLGEDLKLAHRFRELMPSEADPIELGHRPYYMFAPWDNEHFSFKCKDYEEWGEKNPPAPGAVYPELVPMFNYVAHREMKRPFQNSWWTDATR